MIISNYITKAQIKWFLIALAGIALFVLCFRSCDKTPPAKFTPTVVNNEAKIQKEADMWKDSSKYWRGKVRELEADRQDTKRVLAKADKEITRLIDLHRNFKRDNDTPMIIQNCDSLVEVIEWQQLVIKEQEINIDELVGYYDQALAASDSSALKQTQLASDLRIALATANTKAAELTKDYNRELKKKKRERTLNRVLAGAVMVTGGLLLVK